MDRIGRIGQMEEKLDAALEAIRALEDAAEAYASVLEDIRGIYDMLEDNREVLERLRALVRQADELADQAPGMGRESTAPEED